MRFTVVAAANLTTGAPLPGAQCFVYATGTQSIAQLYDINGIPTGNPVVAASNGLVGFQVADGLYDLQFVSGSYTSPLIQKQMIVDDLGGNEFRTSSYGTLQLADAAAFAAGGTVIIDSPVVLSASYVMGSPAEVRGGTVSPTNFNLTFIRADYLAFADPYAYIFRYTGTGRIFFSQRSVVSPCWWGADPTGNALASIELLTRQACQYAEAAVDSATPTGPTWGSVVFSPPGHYRLDVTIAVVYRSSHHKAEPGTVRYSFNPATVTAYDGKPGFTKIAMFTNGNPQTGTNLPLFNPAFIGGGGTKGIATSCFSIGAWDPATVSRGLVWYGIDFVSEAFQGGTFLGFHCLLMAIFAYTQFDVLVEKCRFIGFPCDGLNLNISSGTVRDCDFMLNGFYGGANAAEGTSRNGMSFTGFTDVLTPSNSTDQIHIVNCRAHCNANTGFAPGYTANSCIVEDCTTIGNGTTHYEHILFAGENITQWVPGVTVNVNQLMYVPGSVANVPPNLGGLIYQCTVSGVTGATNAWAAGTIVGQVGIVDNTVTWQCIGNMPANGLVPATYQLLNNVDDGAIPKTLTVPWLGTVNVPAPTLGSNGINAQGHLVFNGGNEKRMIVKNVIARNFGYSGSVNPAGFVSNNGGEVIIDGYYCDNWYVATQAIAINLDQQLYFGGSHYQGISANNRSHVRIKNLIFRNPTAQVANTSLLYIAGNLRSVSIDGVESHNWNGNGIIRIDPATNVANVLESGRIRNCHLGSCLTNAIQFVWHTDGSSMPNGFDIEDNEIYGYGAAGANTGFGILIGASGAMTLAGQFRIKRNKIGAGGEANYPLAIAQFTSGLSLDAQDNNCECGPWLPNYAGVAPKIINSIASLSAGFKQRNNDIPGQREMWTSGNAAPTTGAWTLGDRSVRGGATTGNPWQDYCTVTGELDATPMAGCAITINNATNGTYTGTPPLPGQYVTQATAFPAGARVTRADSGIIYFNIASVGGAVAGGALAYQAAPTFKTSSLS